MWENNSNLKQKMTHDFVSTLVRCPKLVNLVGPQVPIYHFVPTLVSSFLYLIPSAVFVYGPTGSAHTLNFEVSLSLSVYGVLRMLLTCFPTKGSMYSHASPQKALSQFLRFCWGSFSSFF